MLLRFTTVFDLSQRMHFDLTINMMTKNTYTRQHVVVEGYGRQ